MALYESSKVKERLQIRSADTTFDTTISNLGSQCDSEVIERIRTARKERQLDTLPAIDENSTDVPQMLKDASTDRVVAYMFLIRQRIDTFTQFKEKSDTAINDYIMVLEQDKILYGESV